MEWRDVSTTWEQLVDLKEAYPIEVAEYATSRGLTHETAFAWWVGQVLAKRNLITAVD